MNQPSAVMDWAERIRAAVSGYAEPLLRLVARRLIKPRASFTPEELAARMVEASGNAVLLDRRLKELTEPARSILALLALSQQPVWRLGGILELLSFIPAASGMDTVFELFQSGFLFPQRSSDLLPLESFEQWLASSGETQYRVWSPPAMTARALALGPPALEKLTDLQTIPEARVQEEDGWELPLRVSYLWQQVKQSPLRLTAQGEFYKRDTERLQDPVLVTPLPPLGQAVPDLGHALVLLALSLGLLRRQDAEISTGEWPSAWRTGTLPSLLAEVWALQPGLSAWTAGDGWRGWSAAPSPLASAGVLAIVALATLQPEQWVPPAAVAEWVAVHHAYWKDFEHPPDLRPWAESYLLGYAAALRLVQTTTDSEEKRWVRLAPMGRMILGMEAAPSTTTFPRTLLVQPNLEILAYRQGLTPALVAELSHVARWKSLGAACTLQLEPETVYRGLEAGASLDQLLLLLQRHSVRELPPNVVNALRTWSDKRERISVFAAAQLLEFKAAEDAELALSRGLPAIRLSDTCLLVPREEDLDFRHFRLLGSRDYSQPPGVCIDVAEDGVTLTVDEARADLLLLSELENYAERLPDVPQTGQRRFRLAPARLQPLGGSASSVRQLEEWFQQRTGQPLTPSVRLLLGGAEVAPLALRRLIVLQTPTSLVADGLEQWPQTRPYLAARLGPQSLAIVEEALPDLQAALAALRLRVQE